MPSVLEVEIINKVTGLAAVAEERAALANLATAQYGPTSGFMMLGAPGSGAATEKELAQKESAFKRYETQVKNATIVAGQAGEITDGLARKMSALGALGITPATVAMISGVIAVGTLVSKLDEAALISEKNEVANKDLAQAYNVLGEKVPIDKIDQFINANERFIPSIYDVKEGFAQLARAKLDDATQMRVMNDALDLAAAKHISLDQAVDILTKAYSGNVRGLLDLGFNQKDVNDAVGKGADKAGHYEAVLKEVEPRIKGARDDASDLSKAQHEQNTEWEKFAIKIGPLVTTAQTEITKATTTALGFLSLEADLGATAGKKIDAFLISNAASFGEWARAVVNHVNDVISALDHIPGVSIPMIGAGSGEAGGSREGGGMSSAQAAQRGFGATASKSGRSL